MAKELNFSFKFPPEFLEAIGESTEAKKQLTEEMRKLRDQEKELLREAKDTERNTREAMKKAEKNKRNDMSGYLNLKSQQGQAGESEELRRVRQKIDELKSKINKPDVPGGEDEGAAPPHGRKGGTANAIRNLFSHAGRTGSIDRILNVLRGNINAYSIEGFGEAAKGFGKSLYRMGMERDSALLRKLGSVAAVGGGGLAQAAASAAPTAFLATMGVMKSIEFLKQGGENLLETNKGASELANMQKMLARESRYGNQYTANQLAAQFSGVNSYRSAYEEIQYGGSISDRLYALLGTGTGAGAKAVTAAQQEQRRQALGHHMGGGLLEKTSIEELSKNPLAKQIYYQKYGMTYEGSMVSNAYTAAKNLAASVVTGGASDRALWIESLQEFQQKAIESELTWRESLSKERTDRPEYKAKQMLVAGHLAAVEQYKEQRMNDWNPF